MEKLDGNKRKSGEGLKKNENMIQREFVGEIVAQVVGAIQPMIMECFKTMMVSVKEDIETMKNDLASKEVKRLQRENMKQKFELDKLEQYTRKDNIKVFRINEVDNEETNEIVVSVANDMGLYLKKILAVKLRGIIARFVRRDAKIDFMKNKKKLKSVTSHRLQHRTIKQ